MVGCENHAVFIYFRRFLEGHKPCGRGRMTFDTSCTEYYNDYVYLCMVIKKINRGLKKQKERSWMLLGRRDGKGTILIGNGINRSFSSRESWLDLINSFSDGRKFNENDLEGVPFPLKIVIASRNNYNEKLKQMADRMKGGIESDEQAILIKQILSLPIRDIITTNYGFELETVLSGIDIGRVSDYKISGMTDYIKGQNISRAEAKYFLHTYHHGVLDGKEKRIWHIHGHAKNPSSIILNHYDYGRLLYRMNDYLADVGNKYKLTVDNNTEMKYASWIDSFIMDDVYIVGFGFDFSEMDLWWLLERKSREKAEHGTVHFYEPIESEKNRSKYELLRIYDVQNHDMGIKISDSNHNDIEYREFYDLALKDIKKRLETY